MSDDVVKYLELRCKKAESDAEIYKSLAESQENESRENVRLVQRRLLDTIHNVESLLSTFDPILNANIATKVAATGKTSTGKNGTSITPGTSLAPAASSALVPRNH